MEKKCFVRVATTYAAKNKLCKQLIDELMPFDNTLFEDAALAKRMMNKKFMQVVKDYMKAGGRAQLPNQKQWNTGDGFGFSVEDSIVLIGHEVKSEVTE